MTLVAGPVALETPPGVTRVDVETAEQMAEAVMAALPADAAILVAAVADWRVEPSPTKLKKGDGPPKLKFVPTRDILAEISAHPQPTAPAVGFAAETDGSSPMPSPSGRQGRRLDRRQRRLGRRDGRAAQPGPSGDRRRGRGLAGRRARKRSRASLVERIAAVARLELRTSIDKRPGWSKHGLLQD